MKTYEAYLAEAYARRADELKAQIAASNDGYDAQAAKADASARAEIAQVQADEAAAYAKSRVQQSVDSRLIAERVANLGLSGSGLAAVQKAGLQTARRAADTVAGARAQKAAGLLHEELSRYLAEIETERKQAEAGIRQKSNQAAADEALDLYEGDRKAETDRETAAIKAEQALREAALKAETDRQKALAKAGVDAAKQIAAALKTQQKASNKSNNGGK